MGDPRIKLRINFRIDLPVVSDWLSGDGVGEDPEINPEIKPVYHRSDCSR